MSRPDHVKCIKDAHTDNAGKTWCGKRIGMEYHFISIDHAAFNGRNEGRIVACAECTAAIIKALQNGQEES